MPEDNAWMEALRVCTAKLKEQDLQEFTSVYKTYEYPFEQTVEEWKITFERKK